MSDAKPPVNSLDSPGIQRLTPVLGPGHTYVSITDKISAIVLTRPTSIGWLAGFAVCFVIIGQGLLHEPLRIGPEFPHHAEVFGFLDADFA